MTSSSRPPGAREAGFDTRIPIAADMATAVAAELRK